MNEIDTENESLEPLSLQFPSEEAQARALACQFQALPPEERWRQVVGLFAFGHQMVEASPLRAQIRKKWQEEEEEWKRIQRNLMVAHGK